MERQSSRAIMSPEARGSFVAFALEAKPNEPRGDIYMATTGVEFTA